MHFVDDEGGFSAPGTAVALLLVLSLTFATAASFTTFSRSGHVQYVADAGALAADTVVAEFITAGQVVDALLLSMSLTGVTLYAISAIASFVPGGASVATGFAKAGRSVLNARDKSAKTAIKSLDSAQKALPALCAVKASASVSANAQVSGVDYAGTALTVPLEGISARFSDGQEVRDEMDKIETKEKEVQQSSEKANDAQHELDENKKRAWLADCGSSGMNMQERAGHLASLPDAVNPKYSLVDAWSFSVPLSRAKKYYQTRLSSEPGVGYAGSPEAIGQSIARKAFYRYALDEVSKGSVISDESGFERPNLKMLARNTTEIKQTYLYTESAYPVSETKGKTTLHAYEGCPEMLKGSRIGTSPVASIDKGTHRKCDVCKFSATTLGRVPAASTSIDNGFEHYYRIVVESANQYEQALHDAQEARKSLEDARKSISGNLEKAIKALKGDRYDPQPPGRYGCICVVLAPSLETSNIPFVDGEARTGIRAAISAATLAPDDSVDQGKVVEQIARNVALSDTGLSALGKTVIGAWGFMLGVYESGTEGFSDVLSTLFGAVPLVGTELSDWAVSGFEDALDAAGLEPANLIAYKPVLANTSHVLEREDGAFAKTLRSMKWACDAGSSLNRGDLDTLLDLLEDAPLDIGEVGENGIVLMRIALSALGWGMQDKEVTLNVPTDMAEQYARSKLDFRMAVGG